MEANEYQAGAITTEVYTKAANHFIHDSDLETQEIWLQLAYCTGKLNGEAGEVAELVFKALRDGGVHAGLIDHERAVSLRKELGDVLWYVANICDILGFNLSSIMEENLEKLADRKERGVITGDGNDR